MIQDTSIKCYDEIREEDIYDNDMQMVLEAIRKAPLMTGRELTQIILNYDDMNKVRPRITDLKTKGIVIYPFKRKCTISGREAYVICTLEGLEQHILKKIGFIEKEYKLYSFKENDIILFQDFRQGKRRSYAFKNNESCDYKELNIYKQFKGELDKHLKINN